MYPISCGCDPTALNASTLFGQRALQERDSKEGYQYAQSQEKNIIVNQQIFDIVLANYDASGMVSTIIGRFHSGLRLTMKSLCLYLVIICSQVPARHPCHDSIDRLLFDIVCVSPFRFHFVHSIPWSQSGAGKSFSAAWFKYKPTVSTNMERCDQTFGLTNHQHTRSSKNNFSFCWFGFQW